MASPPVSRSLLFDCLFAAGAGPPGECIGQVIMQLVDQRCRAALRMACVRFRDLSDLSTVKLRIDKGVEGGAEDGDSVLGPGRAALTTLLARVSDHLAGWPKPSTDVGYAFALPLPCSCPLWWTSRWTQRGLSIWPPWPLCLGSWGASRACTPALKPWSCAQRTSQASFSSSPACRTSASTTRCRTYPCRSAPRPC